MGHLKECLLHFGKNLRGVEGTKESVARKKPMADFCGVQVSSMNRWFRDEDLLPNGEVRIKLMCFLQMLGYKVIELDAMAKVPRNFAELIGFGVLKPFQASELLGYTSVEKACHLYSILLRGLGMSEQRKQQMFEVWMAHKEELERKKAEAEEKYYWDFSSQLPSTQPSKAQSSLAIVHFEQESGETKLFRFAAAIDIMTGLLKLLDKNTEFSELGCLTDAETKIILKLSGCLSDLSSKIIFRHQRKEEADGA
jgi:hypothetical protein